MSDRPFNLAQLAQRWQCSERHVRDMIGAGKLKAFRHGQSLRIPMQAVREVEVSAGNGKSKSS